MQLLTICIPTYNRSNFVLPLLEFLHDEVNISGKIQGVDIIVSDNKSDIDHREKIIDFHKNNPFFNLILNEENLGLIGNIHRLNSEVNSEYVWFLGDDDILKIGAIKQIVEILYNHLIDYVFLNFDVFFDSPNNVVSTNNLLSYGGLTNDGTVFATDFFNENGTACMFMSASIHKTKAIREVISLKREALITDPLLFFFKSAKGSVYVKKDVLVLDRLSQISWKNEQMEVFAWKVPLIVAELIDIGGYDESVISKMLVRYFKKQKNYIITLVKSPREAKLKITKFIGLKALHLTLISGLHLLKVSLRKISKKR